MMGRGGTSSTIGAMHLGTSALAFAAGKALQDGVHRAYELRAVDDAHAVGAQRYAAIIAHKRNVMRAESISAAERLVRNRKQLHG